MFGNVFLLSQEINFSAEALRSGSLIRFVSGKCNSILNSVNWLKHTVIMDQIRMAEVVSMNEFFTAMEHIKFNGASVNGLYKFMVCFQHTKPFLNEFKVINIRVIWLIEIVIIPSFVFPWNCFGISLFVLFSEFHIRFINLREKVFFSM